MPYMKAEQAIASASAVIEKYSLRLVLKEQDLIDLKYEIVTLLLKASNQGANAALDEVSTGLLGRAL